MNNIHSIESNINNIDELPAAGEYEVVGLGVNNPVAVSTLKNIELAQEIFNLKPRGLSIVGKTETENIGIEKIIKNIVSVPSIKYLILCGKDSEGHFSGNTILSLMKNGVDDKNKIIGSKGKKPILVNLTKDEIEEFRNQIKVIDMIECESLPEILDKIEELSKNEIHEENFDTKAKINKYNSNKVETINAQEKDPEKVKLDAAGYFVIMIKNDSSTILVEHYGNDNKLLHIVKGNDARNIYWTIIENGWVTELSHAAYLGKELARAEISFKENLKYVQDKA